MELPDAVREIRRSVDTGKVVFGVRETQKNVLKGNGQLIIVSASCPKTTQEKISHWSTMFDIPVFEYPGKGLELGSVCGKPFSIATLLVLDAGKSKVQDIVIQPGRKNPRKQNRNEQR
ncbi:MAG: 50S ribosomal protein L30e [Candidatus Diapherotrites archaeon]|nr:50S ribosomal protein L30e [Candidatus Diapherotrites archaeon]